MQCFCLHRLYLLVKALFSMKRFPCKCITDIILRFLVLSLFILFRKRYFTQQCICVSSIIYKTKTCELLLSHGWHCKIAHLRIVIIKINSKTWRKLWRNTYIYTLINCEQKELKTWLSKYCQKIKQNHNRYDLFLIKIKPIKTSEWRNCRFIRSLRIYRANVRTVNIQTK